MSLSKQLNRLNRFSPRVELLESRLQPGSVLPAWGLGGPLAADVQAADAGSLTADPLFEGLFSQAAHQDHRLLELRETATMLSGSATVAAASGATVVHDAGGFVETAQSTPVLAGAAETGQHAVQLVTVVNASPTLAQQATQGVARKQPVAETARAVQVSRVIDVSGSLRQTNLEVRPVQKIGSDSRTPPTLAFSTYLGLAGEDGLRGVTRDSSGNIYVSGYSEDAGKIGVYVARLNADATAVAWAVTLANPNPGRDEAAGLALNAAEDRLYFVGAIDNGSGDPNAPTDGVLFALNAADGTAAGNGIQFLKANLTGVTVGSDGSVYASGSAYDDVGATNVALVAKTDADLNLPPIYAVGVGVAGNNLFSRGSQSVAVDPAGNAFVATVFEQGGDRRSALFSLTPAGGIGWGGKLLFFENVNPGDAGGMSGIVYSNSFLYLTGQINITEGGTPLHHDLLLTKHNAADGSQVWGFRWYVDDRIAPFARVGDWGSGSIGLVNGNHPVVTGPAIDPVQYPPADPPTQGVDVCTTHFGPNGNVTTLHDDGDPENCIGGAGSDAGSGLVMDGNSAIIVGVTNSADFPTTPGVIQETYGGDPSDGFASRFAV